MSQTADILVGCEFSGIVRDAFREKGFNAVSCDLRRCEQGDPHIQGDVFEAIDEVRPRLLIAHPPCTYLCNSGVRWLYEKDCRWKDMVEGAVFFRSLLEVDVEYIAVENPVMHKWARKIVGRGPNFTCQPWQFGDGEKKRVCWWTKNLPELEPTDVVPEEEREERVHKMGPSVDRGKERSRFFPGMADAMAEQWGEVVQQ